MNNFIAHILVVDDDDGIRSLVKQYLNENNFLVTTANSAENAREKVSVIKFDLIVLDVMMPGKSGLDFIKENKSEIDTPIILLTAKGEAEGAVLILVKIHASSITEQYVETVLHILRRGPRRGQRERERCRAR